MSDTKPKRILIIGGDAAGMSAASQVKRAHPEWDLTVLEKGQDTSYGACGIPYVFGGEIDSPEDLVVVSPAQFREKRGINVRTSCEVRSIDTERKELLFLNERDEEENLAWDKLLIATGARAILPPWPGIDLAGIFTIRSLQSARDLHSHLAAYPEINKVVIVGGGYIGLEMAEAFYKQGKEVQILEKADRIFGNGDPGQSALIAAELAEKGIEVQTGVTVTGFEGDSSVQSVSTDRGTVTADLVLVSLGVRPNSELAANAGLALGVAGAIRVDNRLQTSHPDILAAGDCATSFHRVTGLETYIPLALTANRAGRMAGEALSGAQITFPGVLGTNAVKVLDKYAAGTGLTEDAAADAGFSTLTVTAEGPNHAHYYPGHSKVWTKLVFEKDNGRILGAFMVGDDSSVAQRIDIIATAISAGMNVTQFSQLDLAYAPPFSPVWDPVLQAANKAVFKLS